MEQFVSRSWKIHRESFNSNEYFVIELEPEKWLAWWSGKGGMPAIANLERNSKQFSSKESAERELKIIRMSHDFLLAAVRTRVRF